MPGRARRRAKWGFSTTSTLSFPPTLTPAHWISLRRRENLASSDELRITAELLAFLVAVAPNRLREDEWHRAVDVLERALELSAAAHAITMQFVVQFYPARAATV